MGWNIKTNFISKNICYYQSCDKFTCSISGSYHAIHVKYNNVDWVYSQWEYLLGFLKKAFTIKINFGDIFSKLPAVVALLTYSLERYNESLKRYLTSSKTEKTLMKTLAKEKQN